MAKNPHPTVAASQQLSRPYFTNKVTFNSLHAQQVFERGFEICSYGIYSLSIVLRVIGTDEQAREVESIVDDRINKMFEAIRVETEQLDKLADANGIGFSGITYSNPKSFDARITSPRAVRYIGLLREFDSLVAKFDALWLSGSMPDGNYARSLYDWKRKLLRLAGDMRNLAGRAISAAKRKSPLGPDAGSTPPIESQSVPASDLLPASETPVV